MPDRSPLGRVFGGLRRSFVFAGVLCFVIELLSLAPIIYMWNAFDRVLNSRSLVTLISLTVLVLGAYMFWSAMEWIRARLMVRLSLRVDWELAAEAFDASFRRHASRRGVNVQQVMGDLLELRQFLAGRPVLTILEAPFALLFIAVGAAFHPYLAVFSLIAAAIMLVAAFVNQRLTSDALKASNDANTESLRQAAAVLRQADSTLALGMMPAMRRRWYQRHRDFLTLQVNASEAAGVSHGFTSFLQHSFQSLGMALCLYLAIEGLITSGMAIAAAMLVSRAVGPLQNLISQWSSIVKARQAYRRLDLLLKEDEKLAQQMTLPPPEGRLSVAAVSGVPPGGQKPVVFDVSFELAPGQALAVVGPSASGKSSLARLLVGVWRPARGSVRLDGVELSEWNHDELGPRIGYVPQDIEFFEGTVADNIARMGKVDPDAVVAAARMAGMHEVILAWPQGYDTELGDSGFALSGGQKQRLAIARALYGSPRYVVLDEPNANLDETGEQALLQAMLHLRREGATVIVTTHRPRLIGAVDYMLVLKAGRQVGFGSPKDLMEAVRRAQPAAADAAALPDEAQPAPQEAAPTQVAATLPTVPAAQPRSVPEQTGA